MSHKFEAITKRKKVSAQDIKHCSGESSNVCIIMCTECEESHLMKLVRLVDPQSSCEFCYLFVASLA